MRYSNLITSTLIVTGLFAGAAVAQQASPSAPSGTMDSSKMMQGGGEGMPMMGMMREMSTMMGNCNKMMQSMMDKQNQGSPGQPQTAPKHKNG